MPPKEIHEIKMMYAVYADGREEPIVIDEIKDLTLEEAEPILEEHNFVKVVRCKDCEHFEILYEPYRPGGQLLDWGKAHCKKHDMVLDFSNHRKINRIECVETELSEVEDMSGRYIDADVLKEQMLKYGFHSVDLTVTEFVEDTLPTADVPQWIPCSERLPEESGRYLVTRGLNACGSLWNRIYIANYSDLMGLKSERIWWQGNVGKSDFERLKDVIAWQPLPEP